MNEGCLFCKIVKGDTPCHKVYEDEETIAILDAFPEVDGHILVIPKKHVENIFDGDLNVLKNVLDVSKKISILMKKNLKVDGVNIVNNSGREAGQIVPHLHFHILPRFKNDGRNLKFEGPKLIKKDFEEILKKLKGEENESR